MPITVVVVRDEHGAPATREVYAEGARFRRGSSGLEIMSVEARLLSLYPDGNWLSVYAGDVVAVESISTAASVDRKLDLSAVSGGMDGSTAAAGMLVDGAAVAPEAADADTPADEDDDDASTPALIATDGTEDAEHAEHADGADAPNGAVVASDAFVAEDGAEHGGDSADDLVSLPSGRQSVAAVPTQRPAGMQPVTFRRPLRAGPSRQDVQATAAEQRSHSQLRPLVFRPRTLGRPAPDAAPEDDEA